MHEITTVYALFRQSDSQPGETGPIRSTASSTPEPCDLPTEIPCCFAAWKTGRGLSHLCAARSANGIDGWRIDPEPTLMANPRSIPKKSGALKIRASPTCRNCEQYAVAYTSFARGGPGVSLALTKDFRSFERFGVIMPPEDKDAALLPRRIGGRWALIHRPVTTLGAHMWISYSPDLRHWGSHKVILEARRGGWWDANKIGLCSPPIETAKGWLTIYHGVRQTASGSIYRLGLALFDLEQSGDLPATGRLLDVRPGSAVRARRRREGRCVSLRTDHRRGWRHDSSVLRSGRFLRGVGHGQHPRSALMAGREFQRRRRNCSVMQITISRKEGSQ